MHYELRLEVPDEETGVRLAREIVLRYPDGEPELIDARTKRAATVAASRRWREELTQKLGYG